ncbi:UNVERIFIED_CONTAM: hypothetical protein FKN15_050252 [Acipenser sinensis]
MEIEDLIKKLEQLTAAQQEANRLQREANRVQRQEWGLPDLEVSEPEVSELQPVLAKVVWPAPQGSPAVDQESQGAEQGSLVAEQDSPAAELEVLPLATDGGGGEEHTSTTAPVPCSILCDTLPECPDLPVLDLVARSVHHQARSVGWSPTPLPLKLQTSQGSRLTSFTFPLPPTVFPLENQKLPRRSRDSHLCLLLHPPGYRTVRQLPQSPRFSPLSQVHGPFPRSPEKGSTRPQVRPERMKRDNVGLEGGWWSFKGGGIGLGMAMCCA